MLAYLLSMKMTSWLGTPSIHLSAYVVMYLYPIVLFLVKDFPFTSHIICCIVIDIYGSFIKCIIRPIR